jgi:orsellinic acid C3-O-methyltransferase
MGEHESALFLYQEAMAYTYSAALRAAAEVGLGDALGDRTRTVDELAAATGTTADGLYRVLRLLAARGIVAEVGAGRFRLTELGSALRGDATVPARAGILMFTDTMFWRMTHAVADIIREPRPSFEHLFGRSLAEYFGGDQAVEDLYYEGMATVSEAEHPALVRCYDFPDAGVVADVGGGRGGLLRAVLSAHPHLRGILLDQPHVVKVHGLDTLEAAGRVQVVAGDFLAGVPAADLYLIKRILHNWDDEQSIRILRNCRDAMAPGGRVVVIDAVIPSGPAAHQSKQMDFMMLSAMTGQERTEEQLRRLFAAAGLRVTRVIDTRTPMAMVEGVRA